MAHYEIKKNVPLPFGKGGLPRYPMLDNMEVGDSFTVPTEEKTNVSSAAHAYSGSRDKKFTVRRLGDNYCCWRIK